MLMQMSYSNLHMIFSRVHTNICEALAEDLPKSFNGSFGIVDEKSAPAPPEKKPRVAEPPKEASTAGPRQVPKSACALLYSNHSPNIR